ncbi:MAG: TlpA family protein disulfide reductase [Acidobacteria bacterium]|nr:TlpA family protein disulfide reductase [Acidobacteriota bacterium]
MMNRRQMLALGAAAVSPLAISAQPTPGKPAGELVITQTSCELMLLSSLKGKVVVLEILLTTCPHCQACASTMQKVYTEMNGAFQPVGAAIDPNNMTEARMKIPQFIYSNGLKFPVGWTNRDMAYQWLGANPNVAAVYFPQLIIIDKQGVIREYHPATEEAYFKDEANNLRKSVERYLGPTPGKAAPKR